MTLKSDAKFEEQPTLSSKNDMRNLLNLNASSGKSENFHFDVLLLSKCIMFEPKKYRWVLCHNTEEWSKPWRKTNFLFEKWHEKFGEF